MSSWIEAIKKEYKSSTDKELLKLSSEHAPFLRDEALEALKEEIKSRGLDENANISDIQKATEPKEVSNKQYSYVVLLIVFIAFLFATLPFHYVPSALMVFPKDHLTFSYTIITQGDIDELVKRYNNASFFEKTAIQNESLFRKLSEKGLIFEEQEKPNLKPTALVSIDRLTLEFNSDSANAKKKYSNTNVEMSGIIEKIDKDRSGHFFICFSAHNIEVQCLLVDKDAQKDAENLKIGQQITLKGKFFDYTFDKLIDPQPQLMFSDCIIENE